MAEEWNGLLLLDKPEGPTSHDIVYRVRRATGQRRIGHGGTLDPMATGLLPLVLGRATRLVQYLPHSPKVYRGNIRLGLTTTTDDITGETLTSTDGPLPGPDAVIDAAGALTGRLDQRAPSVSAKQVGGRRLYRLAREGKTVEAPTSVVEVERFELAPTDRPEIYAFEAEVSAGTYSLTFSWEGRNWNGPSDTMNPVGPPFPPGYYSFEVSAVGTHNGAPFEVVGTFPILLVP